MLGSLIKEPKSIPLKGEEANEVRDAIFTMLWMTGDCDQVNKLVDCLGQTYLQKLGAGEEDKLDIVDAGYIVWTGSAEALSDYLKGKALEHQGFAVTVVLFDPEGSAVAEFDWKSGEVRLWLGTAERFCALADNVTQAW